MLLHTRRTDLAARSIRDALVPFMAQFEQLAKQTQAVQQSPQSPARVKELLAPWPKALRDRRDLIATPADTLAKLRRFPSRFQELEQEVQETQRLHQRVAELTDIVAEILVPAADRDDERIRAVLAKYNETSF